MGVLKVIKLVCTAVGGVTVKQVFDSIVSLWWSGKVNSGACYQAKIVTRSIRWDSVKMSNFI